MHEPHSSETALDRSASIRADSIKHLIPSPPSDVSSLRISFSNVVSKQWRRFVLPTLGDAPPGPPKQAGKVRFMAEMYARACYSMLLVSARSPVRLRFPMQIAAALPFSRQAAVRCSCWFLSSLEYLVERSVHRQLALMATLMGVMDHVLDEAALAGQDSVLRVASMLSQQPQVATSPLEITLSVLTRSLRAAESKWQREYWDEVLFPATREYCSAEALAVANVQDPTGLGHRWAGIEAAIKGMWYVVGPCMGLANTYDRFQRARWNREQQWMADTSLLMQMIDDWVDEDEDLGKRPTPVTAGTWKRQAIQELYARTASDLAALLEATGVKNEVFKGLFSDLYVDYIYTALDAMQSGLAA